MTTPLEIALERLRAEVAEAETFLASLADASLADRIAAASTVSVRRRALLDTASGRRSEEAVRSAAAGDAGARTLADALANLPEPAEESAPGSTSDDPLSRLFG